MKLAISGTETIFQIGKIEALLKAANTYGLEWIELWIPDNVAADDLERAKKLLDQHKVKVATISSWKHLNMPGEELITQQFLLDAIDMAEFLGARHVNVYFGGNPAIDAAQAIANCKELLKPVLEKASQKKVMIVIENEFDPANEDPHCADITRKGETLLTLMEAVDSPWFKCTFDACNFYFAGEEPFPKAYSILKKHIGYVHLKDGARYVPELHDRIDGAKIWNDPTGRYICLDLGLGAINYAGLLNALKHDGYAGFVTLEPHTFADDRIHHSYVHSLKYLESFDLN